MPRISQGDLRLMPGAGLQNYANCEWETEGNPYVLHSELLLEDYFHEAVDYIAEIPSRNPRNPSHCTSLKS